MTENENNTHLSLWLLLCCCMIFMMILIGAITRLTESGLSMVEWRAMMDMLPPLNHTAWITAFEKYQVTPEFVKINHAMTLEEFKNIYFWEWFHRLWGRLIGLVYALPLVYFWLREKIPQQLKPRFVIYLFLGGLQGFIGWFMVKSGLINEPRVSHYRLALHLGTAFLLLALLWVQALTLLPKFTEKLKTFSYDVKFCLKRHYVIGFVFLIITFVWGAFVAGLDAGLACADFPKTCMQWIPSELFFQNQFIQNILHEPTAVQFVHRILGTMTFVLLFSLGIRLIKTRQQQLKKIGLGLHGMILLQWLLGIATIHSHVAIPVAVAHQAGAVITMLMMLTAGLFLLRKNKLAI